MLIVFGLTALLKFRKYNMLFSGSCRQDLPESLLRLELSKLRSMAHVGTFECLLCS